MLACLHFLVTEFYQFPFFSWAPKIAGPAHDYFVKSGAMIQILAFTLFRKTSTLYTFWKKKRKETFLFVDLELVYDKLQLEDRKEEI
jgi:hypothetical protein